MEMQWVGLKAMEGLGRISRRGRGLIGKEVMGLVDRGGKRLGGQRGRGGGELQATGAQG